MKNQIVQIEDALEVKKNEIKGKDKLIHRFNDVISEIREQMAKND